MPSKPHHSATAQRPALSAKLRKLLGRVVDFYHTAFGEDPRAQQYLESRGITDKSLYSAHKIGFANGTLLNTIPSYGTNGLADDHVQWLKACEVETVQICFDPDASGRTAGAKAANKLESEGFKTHQIELSDGHDLKTFFF